MAPERSNGRFGALFLLSEAEKHPKILVYFLRFFALQRTTKKVRPEGIEPNSHCYFALMKQFDFGNIAD